MSPQTLLPLLIAVPGVLFLSLSVLWLLGVRVPERAISRITKAAYALLVILCAMIGWQMRQGGLSSVHVSLGDWFTVADYGFPLSLLIDKLSLPLVCVTVVLAGVVGSFSVTLSAS